MITSFEWVGHLKSVVVDPNDINKLLEKAYNAIIIGASIDDILMILDLCTLLKGVKRDG